MVFGHLHLHTEYSPLDSIVQVAKLPAFCKERKIDAVAITDHGNIDGALKFYKACKEGGIQPIIGCELYLPGNLAPVSIKEKEKRVHLTILAKNWAGMQNIMKVLNFANKEGFYERPRIDLPNLFRLAPKDVVILSGCAAGLLSLDTVRPIKKCREVYGEDFYLEIMPLDYEDQQKVNDKATRLYKKGYANIVVTNDVHYMSEEDSLTQEVALAITQKPIRKWDDPLRWKFSVQGLYLKTAKEMIESLKQVGVKNSIIKACFKSIEDIVGKTNISIDKIVPTLPNPYPELKTIQEENDFLKRLVNKGLRDKLKKGLIESNEETESRIARELEAIIGGGFTRYFLMVYDLINWAKKHMLVGPGRGSVGGSLVAYLLGITQVNPLRFSLIWERFISEGRIDLPDIDIDFQKDKRDLVIEYLENKYGENNVANVITFGHLKGKSALRDVCRIFDVPKKDTDAMSDAIITRSSGDMRSAYSAEDAFNTFEEGKKFKKKYPIVAQHVIGLEGLIRQSGSHAAGIIVNDKNLFSGDQCVVISKGKHDKIVNWDKSDIEHFGLCKIDALGLAELAVIREVQQRVGIKDEFLEQLAEGSLDDKEVFQLLSEGNTAGVFQFNTPAMKDFLVKMKVADFEDAAAVMALVRPGTLRTGLAEEYVRKRKGELKVTYPNKIYEEITKNTQGIMLYQEQIMFILNRMAGIGWKTTDTVRKAISKSQGAEAIRKFRGEFVAGCKRLGTMSENSATDLFKKIETFGSYSFNKSHCIEYTIIAYITAWLKIHYPVEFLCACLNHRESEERKEEYVQEIKRLGIEVEYPDVNHSSDKWSVHEGKLIMGLKEIQNVGEAACREILAARGNTPFRDKEDFLDRVKKRVVNKKVVMSLEKANALFNSKENPVDVVESCFKFRLQFDETESFKQYLKRVKGKTAELNHCSFLDTMKVPEGFKGRYTFPACYVYGKVKDVRFAMRDYLEEAKEWKMVAYFHLVDENEFYLLSFTKELFQANKEYCESLKGKYIVAEVDKTYSGKYSYMCTNIWDMETLFDNKDFALKGFPFTAKRKLGKVTRGKLDKIVDACIGCPMLAGHIMPNEEPCFYSKNPVPLDYGKYNALIVAEAPGKEEDKAGIPLVGRSGEMLWETLRKETSLKREDICVSNVLKCQPPNNKITRKAPLTKCSKLFLEREIEIIKPIVILSLGRTAADYFGKEGSMFDIAGTYEWDRVRKCFLVWSIHPAAVLYEPSNLKILEKSLKTFGQLLKRV